MKKTGPIIACLCSEYPDHPCNINCNCANAVMSGGCIRCSLFKPIDIVTITKKEYERLLDDYYFLNALRDTGVDNWEGYDIAKDLINKEE